MKLIFLYFIDFVSNIMYKSSERFELINIDIVIVVYLTVSVKGCPVPPMIAKGEYQILPWRTGNSSTIPFYSSAVYMCHRGYILHGSSYISCSPHGWWQPFTVPRCIPEGGLISGREKHNRLKEKKNITTITETWKNIQTIIKNFKMIFCNLKKSLCLQKKSLCCPRLAQKLFLKNIKLIYEDI